MSFKHVKKKKHDPNYTNKKKSNPHSRSDTKYNVYNRSNKNDKPSYRTERSQNGKENHSKTQNYNYPYKAGTEISQIITNNKNKEKKSKKNHELKVIHWNSNGLNGKLNEINLLLDEEKPDIMVIFETKTNNTNINDLYKDLQF